MITSTSLSHPSLLSNVKQAITCAIKHKRESYVKNKRGDVILAIIHTGNGQWRACDAERNDMTNVLMNNLQKWHKGE